MQGFEMMEYLELVTKAFKADLTADFAKMTLAWWLVRDTVKGHFGSIENSLKMMVKEMGDLKTSVESMELAHAKRLDLLENEVNVIKEERAQS